MYVVTNRIPVASDYYQQFEQRFQRRAGQIDKQPGFVRMEILRPQDADSPYLVMTHWLNKQAFETRVGSEDFKLAHQNPLPKDAFIGPSRMEQHEVAIKAGR